MKIEHKESAAELLELINKANYFTKLKLDNDIDNSFNVSLKVFGYDELNLMVSDLLKASILILKTENLSNLTKNADINVMTLLEIALQLLPEEEMELLDDLHKIYLEPDAKNE